MEKQMESIQKRRRSSVPIPRRHKNIKKNSWKRRTKHFAAMTRTQLKEFFGHKWETPLAGCVTRKWDIAVPEGKTIRTVTCTLIGDKNHNLCNIKCPDVSYEAQEIAYAILSMWRGHNIYTFGEEGGYYE
jgi:hypothetical protein